jgi:peptidyl-tRNA hydrolase, PTH1 family
MRFRRAPAEVRHLVVGLGNPGPEYASTRHNVGYMVVDELSRRHRIPIRTLQQQARIGTGEIGGEPAALAKPLTFMNLSGRAVAPLLQKYSLLPANLVVVYDDADLPLGKIRVRARGSAGGQGGLKSIIASLGSPEFPRIRIGIGRSGGKDLVDHVLTGFRRDEREAIDHAIQRAADAVEHLLSHGIEATMNRFNTAEPASEREPSAVRDGPSKEAEQQ